MVDEKGEFSFFQGIHVRIDIRMIHNSIKTYEHQILLAGTSRGVASNETNQAGAGWIITSRSREKLKTIYLYYRVPMATKLGGMVSYLDGLPSIKSHDPSLTWCCDVTT